MIRIKSVSQLDIDAQSLVSSLGQYQQEERVQLLKLVLAAFCQLCGAFRPPGAFGLPDPPCECQKLPVNEARREPSEALDFVDCDGCDRRVLYASYVKPPFNLAPLVLPAPGEKPNIAVKVLDTYADSTLGQVPVWQYRILKKGETPAEDESQQLMLNHFANCPRARMFKRERSAK
jgi:hypothetical protein